MIWNVCARFGIKPPGVEANWDDNVPWIQAMLIAYEQIREHDDTELTAHTGAALLMAGKK